MSNVACLPEKKRKKKEREQSSDSANSCFYLFAPVNTACLLMGSVNKTTLTITFHIEQGHQLKQQKKTTPQINAFQSTAQIYKNLRTASTAKCINILPDLGMFTDRPCPHLARNYQTTDTFLQASHLCHSV